MTEAQFHPIADEALEGIMDSIEDAFEAAGIENYEANYAVLPRARSSFSAALVCLFVGEIP